MQCVPGGPAGGGGGAAAAAGVGGLADAAAGGRGGVRAGLQQLLAPLVCGPGVHRVRLTSRRALRCSEAVQCLPVVYLCCG